jgi:hypothetical protein
MSDLVAEIAALKVQVAELTAAKAEVHAKVGLEVSERYEAERRRDQLKTVVQQLNWRTQNEAELLPSADQYTKRAKAATTPSSSPQAIHTRPPKGDIDFNSDKDAVQNAIGDLLKLSPMSQKKERSSRARKERTPTKEASRDAETFGPPEPRSTPTSTRAEQALAKKEKRAEKVKEDAETARLIIEIKKKKEEDSRMKIAESVGDGEPTHAQRTEIANSLRQAAMGKDAKGLKAAIAQAETFGMVGTSVLSLFSLQFLPSVLCSSDI